MANTLFDVSTYNSRISKTRKILKEDRLDVGVILSSESQYYLTGYDTFVGVNTPQALIIAANNSEPSLVLWEADLPMARATSCIRDFHTYRFGIDSPPEVIAQYIRKKVPSIRRIGWDAQATAANYSFSSQILKSLEHVEFADVSEKIAELRAVKSLDELKLMRKAGIYARAGIEAALHCAKPGLTEIQLAAEIEYAMRKRGSDYWAVPTELTSGSRTVFGHGTPTDRILEPGDLIHAEIGGVEHRYHAVGIQTFSVQKKPSEQACQLYDVARRCVRAGLNAIKPGIVASEIEAPALAILRSEGLGNSFNMRFGYGVGIGFPPSWLEPFKITRTSFTVLREGMTFVLHACLLDEKESNGVLVGGTYAMTSDGAELISGAGDIPLAISN